MHAETCQSRLLSRPRTHRLPRPPANCKRLRKLEARDTKLAGLPALPALQILSTERASLAFIKSLAATPTIEVLHIPNCDLTELPEELRALKKLSFLNFTDNEITKLPRWLAELSLTQSAWCSTLTQSEQNWLIALQRKNRGKG